MFSGTGGTEGVRLFTKVCSELNKAVTFSRCITPCCSEEIMERTVALFKNRIEKADALVVLSCASGIKAANMTGLSIPVVTVLNPVGSVVVASGQGDSELLKSICTVCGRCVLSYTAGICPVYECPAKSIYQPCKHAPDDGKVCFIKPEKRCVWFDINKLGNQETLKELKSFHTQEGATLIAPVHIKHTKKIVRWPVSMFLVLAQFCEKCVRWIQ